MKRQIINPRKKQKVFEGDGFKCCNCGVNGDMNVLEVDHIIPIKDGGTNEYQNLQTLCYKCNINKHYNKLINNQEETNLNKLNPRERFNIIKDIIKSYKDLSWEEFKIIYTQDDNFRIFKLSLTDIYDYFHKMKGINKEEKGHKLRESRDSGIRYFKKEYKLTHEELAGAFNISMATITRALR